MIDEPSEAEDAAEPAPTFEVANDLHAAEESPVNPEDTANSGVPGEMSDPVFAPLGGVTPTAEVGVMRYSKTQLRRSRELLARIHAWRRATKFYPVEHPAVAETTLALMETIGSFHAEGVDVQLGFFEGEILLGEQLLPEESLLFDQLVRDMIAMGIGSIHFRRGASDEELRRAGVVLSSDAEGLKEMGGLESASRLMQLDRIILRSLRTVERIGESVDSEESAHLCYSGAVSLMREIDRLMKGNKQVGTARVKGVVRSLVDNVLTNRYAMLQLTGLKNFDEYTFYHSANVAILALALGSTITQDYRFLSSLGVGALLHDIGKLSLDHEILNKPGTLSPDEWERVRQHPVQGAQMVSVLPGVDKAAIVTILEHHMRHDGAGYPPRVPPRRQHLASRIVAVADSYDAMTSRRSYSAARVQDDAMALMAKGAGSSLDPALVRMFIRLMGVYPPRSVVRLGGGEIAIVLRPSMEEDPVRPVVRVIAAPSGEFITPADIDLAVVKDVSIESCIDPQLLNIDVDSFFN